MSTTLKQIIFLSSYQYTGDTSKYKRFIIVISVSGVYQCNLFTENFFYKIIEWKDLDTKH